MTTFKGWKAMLAAGLVGALAFGAPQASAQDGEAAVLQALEDAIPGTLLHNPLEVMWTPSGNDIRSKVVDAAALTTGQAVQVRNKKRQQNPWDANVSIQIPQAIAKGDEVQVLYWVRTAKAPKGADAAKVTLFLGRNAEPYDNILSHDFNPGSDWEMKQVTGTANADFPAGKVKLEYQIGKSIQTVEFGPVYVSKL